jgi:hypothetical protein
MITESFPTPKEKRMGVHPCSYDEDTGTSRRLLGYLSIASLDLEASPYVV